MVITKKDLQYEYSWSVYKDDDPKVSGKPDNTLLNREEGYEMLYFINKFMQIHNLTSIETANKIEVMIKEFLPSDIRSQENIKVWLEENLEEV